MAVVRSGLAVMRNQKQLTLRLSPESAEQVRARAQELLERFPGVGMLDIVADARLKGEGAILESEIGVVEASIDKQLEALEEAARDGVTDSYQLQQVIRRTIGTWVAKAHRRKPMIIPVVVHSNR